MFTLNSTHERLKSKYRKLEERHGLLKYKWNNLVQRINSLGGEDFLDGTKPHYKAVVTDQQFTQDELRSLIQLVHPDRNGGSEVSVRLSQKINKLRNK